MKSDNQILHAILSDVYFVLQNKTVKHLCAVIIRDQNMK